MESVPTISDCFHPGWRDGEGGGAVKDAKRLDYIFCNTQEKVKSSTSGM